MLTRCVHPRRPLSGLLHRLTRIVAFLLLAGLLGACMPTPAGTALPPCRAEELIEPDGLSPENAAVVDDLSPNLAWEYGGDCEPDTFRVTLYSPSAAYPLHT